MDSVPLPQRTGAEPPSAGFPPGHVPGASGAGSTSMTQELAHSSAVSKLLPLPAQPEKLKGWH